MRTDGRSDITEVIVAFRNLAKAPKSISLYRLTWNMIHDNKNHKYAQLISTPICNEYVGYISGCCRQCLLSKSTKQWVVLTDRLKKKQLVKHSKIFYKFKGVPIISNGPGSSVGTATEYGLDGPGSNPSWDEIFRPSRTALGPTHPPVKWVPGLFRW